jgi:dihydrofolate reductase
MIRAGSSGEPAFVRENASRRPPLHRRCIDAVRRLKQEPGEGLWIGGVTLPMALADAGVIDEYEFVVHPVLAGHGPTLMAGLRERIRLEPVDRREFRSGAVAVRYRPAIA